MPVRFGGRKVSFDLLSGDASDDDDGRPHRRKRRPKPSKKKKKEDELGLGFYFMERRSVVEMVTETSTELLVELRASTVSSHVELRQRNVCGGGEESSTGEWRPGTNMPAAPAMNMDGGPSQRLETMGSLDWKQVINDHPDLLRDFKREA